MFDGAIPKWNWISGVKIEKSDLVKEALYRAYEKLWINLNHLSPTDKTFTKKQKDDFEFEVRESTKEFDKAGEMRRTENHSVDELFIFAKTLKDRTIHLQREPLPPIENLRLEIFAHGALAKLVVDPTSYFVHDLVTNYSRGAHDPKSGLGGGVFNIWFRCHLSGRWLVDAICTLSNI